MKNFYLCTLITLFSFSSFSQITFVKNKDINYKIKKEIIHSHNTHQSSTKSVPFWTDDLSDPSLWTMTDYAHSGTQNWVITTNGPTGTFSNTMGAIASTTAANGFGLYDSDALSVSYTNVQDATLAFNNSIDCSSYPYVNIEFQSNYRKFADSIFVEVSNDNVNWDRYEVHANLTTNTSTANPEHVSMNISPTAGNQATVWFRFRFEGIWDYAWMVDDVAFAETPNNLINIDNETFGGWWVGYQSSGDIGIDYTFNPMHQVMSMPYRFESVISNDGISIQNNVKMHVNVIDAGGGSYSFSSSPMTLYSMTNDTVVTTSDFTPSSPGIHQIDFWASSDAFPTTDTIGRTTIVTDTVYGVDFDWNNDGQNAEGGYYLGRECGGQVLGNAFDVYANGQATSISFHVNDESVPGAEVKVELYEIDASITPYSPVYLGESDSYYLTQNDLNSWKTLKFSSPIDIYDGITYIAAVRGYANPIDTSLISSSSNFNTLSFIQDNGCDIGSGGFAYWYSASKALMIRLNASPPPTSVDYKTTSSTLNVFPNPNDGFFEIKFNNLEWDNYIISVNNMLGQEVYISSEILNGISSKMLDLSHLNKGVYILEFSNSETTISEKIIIE